MSYDKSQATEQFGRWSESYDRSILQTLLFGPSHKALIQRLRQRFGDRPITVLDVGCGTGLFAARLHEAMPAARVCGLDLVRGMITKGQDRWKALRDCSIAIQGDSEYLPFPTATFDALTCANSFHHYPNQANAVLEMRRVLKPGGRLMLIDGYRDAPWGWFIYDVCVTAAEGKVHHASSKTFREYFNKAGFTDVEQKPYRGPAPFLFNEAVVPASVIPAPHFPVGAPVSVRESQHVV